MNLYTEQITHNIVRIKTNDSKGSGMNFYNFLKAPDTPNCEAIDFNLKTFLPEFQFEISETATNVSFSADVNEDWIGFGDVTRKRMYHRGHDIECWVRNVKSYIPVPFFISTKGYAVLVNTTHRIEFDMCAAKLDTVSWRDYSKEIDFYLFTGGSFIENIKLYTQLTGKPQLPPEWAFGLWYICRQEANDYEAVNDALNLRREKIPCDVIGLEPGWMKKHYDLSTEKEWNDEKFPIASWVPNGPHNFINAIRRMGFHFELWECNEYDLSYEEERRRGGIIKNEEHHCSFHKNGEVDFHFTMPRFADNITKKEESWFEHHKKFIDQGVDFFKQDGSYQVNEHPDKLWGNGMLDIEMHNFYPLLYARQMNEGFAQYTKRRPVVFTVSGWTGIQAYASTWTGDTGGRIDTLGGMLNTAVLGHNWITNDMEVMQPEGIHFGYLQPWSQINSWAYFRMPWIQGDKLCEMHKFYGRLRSQLIPYLYSWARETAEQGIPLLMRPLQLEFFDDINCREIMHEYLLGRDLLVAIYKHEVYLPKGRWQDFWTGAIYEGGKTYTIDWAEDKGGGLFVREGAIIPFGPVMQYRGEKNIDELELHIFPGLNKSDFTLYLDNGVDFEYQDGKFASTKISVSQIESQLVIDWSAITGKESQRIENIVFSFKIMAISNVTSVKVDGEVYPFDFVDKEKVLVLKDIKHGQIITVEKYLA